MEESELKTTLWQRVTIIIIALLLLGITLLTYIMVTMSSGSSSESSTVSDEEVTALEEAYTAKEEEINAYAETLSATYFDTFKKYLSEISAFNSTAANAGNLETKDFVVGTGDEIGDDDYNYYAYYIGYCADEEIFDSSFDDTENPTALAAPLEGSSGYIEGWLEGVVGMKIGGVREITIPADLAYGEEEEICGETNSPLRFIVMLIQDEQLATLDAELYDIYYDLLSAYYGA